MFDIKIIVQKVNIQNELPKERLEQLLKNLMNMYFIAHNAVLFMSSFNDIRPNNLINELISNQFFKLDQIIYVPHLGSPLQNKTSINSSIADKLLELQPSVQIQLQALKKNDRKLKKKKRVLDIINVRSIKERFNKQKNLKNDHLKMFHHQQNVLKKKAFQIIIKQFQNQLLNQNINTNEEEIIDEDDKDAYDFKIIQRVIEQLEIINSDQYFNIAFNSQQEREIFQQKKNLFGKIIPLKHIRSSEKFLKEFVCKIYFSRQNKQDSSKIVIVCNQNKRGDQVVQSLEELIQQSSNQKDKQPLFKLSKHLNTKKFKQNQKESWKQDIIDNDIFIFLSKRFLNLIQHGDLSVNQFDYIVFDEASSQVDHPYNLFIHQFMYNHKQSDDFEQQISIQTQNVNEQATKEFAQGDKKLKKKTQNNLPTIIAILSVETSIMNSNQDRKTILYNLKCLANTFNSPLFMITEEEALDIMKAYYIETLSQRYSHQSCNIMYILRNIQYKFQFMEKVIQYLTIKPDACLIQPAPFEELKKLKLIDKKFQLTTKQGKITILEAKPVFEGFLTKAQEIEAKLQARTTENSQSIGVQKPTIISAQYVSNKIRYFSSRLTIDNLLWPFFRLILPTIDQVYHQNIVLDARGNTVDGYQFYSCNIADDTTDPTQSKILPILKQNIKNPRTKKFKKKLESEAYVMLEALKLLHKTGGFLDEYLRPDENRMKDAFQNLLPPLKTKNYFKNRQDYDKGGGGGGTGGEGGDKNTQQDRPGQINQQNQDEKKEEKKNEDDKDKNNQEGNQKKQQLEQITFLKYEGEQKKEFDQNFNQNLNILIGRFNKIESGEAKRLLSSNNLLHFVDLLQQSDNSYQNEFTGQYQQKQKYDRIKELQSLSIKQKDIKYIFEGINQYSTIRFEQFKNNNYHRAHLQHTIIKLSVFITQVLNPILMACNLYEKNKQKGDIKWWNKDQNMINDSQLRLLKKKENLKEEEKDEENADSEESTKSTRQRGIEERYLRKNINYNKFKAYSKIMFNHQKKQSFHENKLYMEIVKTINISAEGLKMPNYLTQHLMPYFWNNSRSKGQFNRQSLLQILLIVLSDKEPINLEFERVKIEMGRLSFIGDQVINLSCIINLLFNGNSKLTEKDLDIQKNQIVNKENLKQKAELFGLNFLKIKSKFNKQKPSSQIEKLENEQQERDLADVVQSLAGYFAIYIGFNAAYLFLVDIGILNPDQYYEVGDDDKSSILKKIQILEDLSQQRKLFINSNENIKQSRSNIYEMIKDDIYKMMSPNNFQLTPFQEVSNASFKKNFQIIKQIICKASENIIDLKTQLVAQKSQSFINELFDTNNSQFEDSAEIQLVNEQKLSTQTKNSSLLTSSFEEDKSDEFKDEDNCYQNNNQKIQDEEKYINDEEPNNFFKFKDKSLLLQSFVHKSFSDQLLIQKEQQEQPQGGKIINDQNLATYNYQILEYLGDSFLNFTVSKLFYLDTALQQENWHSYYFQAQKLHDLKTWFTSNHWLAYLIYENHFFTLLTDQKILSIKEKQSFIDLINSVRNCKDDKQIQKLIENAPRLLLLYDEQNKTYHQQIKEFQELVFKICCINCPPIYLEEKVQPQDRRVLSMSSFQEGNVKDDEDNDDDFYSIQEKFVKFFSDTQEALIGAVFLETCDFEQAQVLAIRLLGSNLIEKFPLKQQQRSKVLAIWNSKKYTTGIKISHTMQIFQFNQYIYREEKDDNVYVRGFMNQMEVRRVKFPKDKKRKVPKFYSDFQLYLEEVYIKFEEYHIKKQSPEVGPYQFLEFNKDFRKNYKSSKSSGKTANYSIIKEAARNIFIEYQIKQNEKRKLEEELKEQIETRQSEQDKIQRIIQLEIELNPSIQQIRQELIKYLIQGLQDAKYEDKHNNHLLLLEQERVRSSKIREFFLKCEIKSINTTAKNLHNFKDFITRLPDKQAYYMHQRLRDLGQQFQENSRRTNKISKNKQFEEQKIEQTSQEAPSKIPKDISCQSSESNISMSIKKEKQSSIIPTESSNAAVK